ncbi:MAG: HAD-IA family hydrolase [Chloroflexi bacterium]|nr:HAD-IA family hydrolase [Chloroflexota bacterium]
MTIKALLLDLDDTLLVNPVETFTQQYIGLLNDFLSNALDIPDFIAPLMSSIKAVSTSLDPRTTNADVFYAALMPQLPVDRATFDVPVAEFYRTVYPRLQAITRPRPDARPFVEWCLAQGYIVVVATNPFFPWMAIEQRLTWAGLPPDEVPFHLVTYLENMHYTKPHPHYYEEILTRVGVGPDEAVMVGDDWNNDILPAHQAGLNTYWITDTPDAAALDVVDGVGSFADFVQAVQYGAWLDTPMPRPLAPGQIAPRLLGSLSAVLGVMADAPELVWAQACEDEWSALEIARHFCAYERDLFRPRLDCIRQEENPVLVDDNGSAGALAEWPDEGPAALAAFAAERLQTVEWLAGLDDAAWARPAQFASGGTTSLLAEANFIATHDRLHLAHLRDLVARCG